MSAIYMTAFCSIYLQIPGLYGENGILPAHLLNEDSAQLKECFIKRKSALCFSSYLGLNTSYMMELVALLGTVLSFIGLVWKKWGNTFFFATLWVLYLSIYKVGQTFLWFQWDILLLEVGFLTIFVASFTWERRPEIRPKNMVTFWAIRWALFRLMFASGVVKLKSGCPTWWGLTALNVHYESQCIPTAVSWYVHHFPDWIHRLCVSMTYVIEIPIAFFFFSPVRAHRIFAFYAQVLFQLCIIITGNYNFFNLLTIVMCLSLLDDVHFGYRRGRDFSTGVLKSIKGGFNFVVKWLGFGALFYFTLAYFTIRVSPKGGLESDINFSKEQFDTWVSKAVPLSMGLGACSLLIIVAEALTSCVFEVRGLFSKLWAILSTLGYSLIIMALFGISLVPFTSLHPPTTQTIWPAFRQWYDNTNDLQLSGSYGLFRHMTGVGGRPEIVLEGSNGLDGPWLEYEFPFKPGKVDRSPPFVAPHQPRVDWQLWFAALGTYKQNPWLVSMVHRLLTGEKAVLNFLDRSSPWRQKAPKYLRVQKYLYHFTPFNSSSVNWWTREHSGEYMPTYSKDHAPLLDYLRKMKLVDQKDIRVKNKFLAQMLDTIRSVFEILENHYTILSLFVAALVVLFTKEKFSRY